MVSTNLVSWSNGGNMSQRRSAQPFAELWGIEELLVSFDGVNITLSRRKDMK